MTKLNKTTIDGFAEFSRKVAGEGMVLLKNEQETLPVKPDDVLAIFGRCQIDYYRSGTGSGGSVNVPYSVSAIEGIRANELIRIDNELAEVYDTYVSANPFDNGGGGWAAEPWFQNEMPLTKELVETSANRADKAMIIIGRTAGEEQDNKDTEGSFRLTELELEMIQKVTEYFEKVVVVLNVSNIIDMSWLDGNDSITSVLYSWHGGMEGGNALADVVSGMVTPSGKLSDTLAYKLESYPSYENFDEELELFYQEDIYLGYRYFETFDKGAVRYPFGFGLSYTTFDCKVMDIRSKGKGLETSVDIQVEVTNVGDQYSGKEVVQVYLEAPQGKLGRPSRALVGFAKTSLLVPGARESLSLSIPIKEFATYDDSGLSGHKSCFLLEEGGYKIFVASDVRSSENSDYTYVQEELLIVESLEEVLAPVQNYKRFRPGRQKEDGSYELIYEAVPLKTADVGQRMKERLPETITMTEDQGYKLIDVKAGKCTLETFIGQLPQGALETIVRGEGMCSPKATSGTAGVFGGVGDNLLHFGIPVACCSDGPSGIRMDTGEEATQVPIGTLLACTWNIPLIEELYVFEGRELHLNKIDTLLGPGMNIHRHPLNGRNFEYFSEDPLLTGLMATAIVKGLKEGGSEGTIKHFAANDQEYNRQGVNSIVSERALREIHLKGFEMAVKEGGAVSIMTTYNPINGIWNASNYDLNTSLLRDEWGFDGIVMTDWWAKMNDPVKGGSADLKHVSSMVRSQNDIFMPVNNFGAEVNSNKDDLSMSIETGVLTIGEVQRCAMNICKFILKAPVIDRPLWKAEIKTYAALPNRPDGDIIKTESICILNIKSDSALYLEVEEPGLYSMVVEMKHDNGPAAQSACNILLNDVYGASANLNGTRGRTVKEKTASIILEKGYYKVAMVYTKPGLEIENIIFVRQ